MWLQDYITGRRRVNWRAVAREGMVAGTPRGPLEQYSGEHRETPRRWSSPSRGDSPRHLRPSASDQDLRRIVPIPRSISVLSFRLHRASRSIHAARRPFASSRIRSRSFDYLWVRLLRLGRIRGIVARDSAQRESPRWAKTKALSRTSSRPYGHRERGAWTETPLVGKR